MNEKDLKFDKMRFWAILILALIGIGLCVELGYIFYKTNFLQTFTSSFCTVSQLIDCDGVAQTEYALSMGVPNAIWGLILYLVMIMLLFVDRIQAKFRGTIFDVFINPRSYIAFLGILSFIISMILAFISIAVIKKICALCFCTYFINLFIALFAMEKGFIQNTIKDFIKGAKEHFILFLIVLIGFVSTLVYLDRSLILSPKLKKERQHKEFFQAKTNKYAIKGDILGKQNAKVHINVYSDFNCPFCRVVNIMLHKAAKTENVIVYHMNFPLDKSCNDKIGITLGGHENSCEYARYAIAARQQHQCWGVTSVFFHKRPQNIEEMEKEFKAAHLNIDMEKLIKDANSEHTKNELQRQINETSARSIMATPTIEINGVIYTGAMPYDDLIKEIRLAEKRANN